MTKRRQRALIVCLGLVWLPGDIIRDEHPLTLPMSLPLSDLTIEVGLYEAEGGQRLPVFTSDSQRVPGDQIFIPYPFNPTPSTDSGGPEPADLGSPV